MPKDQRIPVYLMSPDRKPSREIPEVKSDPPITQLAFDVKDGYNLKTGLLMKRVFEVIKHHDCSEQDTYAKTKSTKRVFSHWKK